MAAPKRIGKYEIQAEIGRGGFGQVFRAYDPSVNRSVALKILLNNKDKDLLKRFSFEATSAGNLRHKNIVTLYEFGEFWGDPFLVMEFIEGETLQVLIKTRKPLHLFEKVNVMTQVAEGLRCAHQNGLMHRDVKPANIMLTNDGTAKIMDFGIARALQDDAGRLTQTGFLIGTVQYMAPELFRTGIADFLCDIFAFGTIFYEFLTYHHPFEAKDPASTMYRITSVKPAPLSEFCPECPAALQAIVERCMAKEREDRYQSLDDFLIDIEPVRLELKTARAALVLVEAKNLVRAGDLEKANIVVRQSIELDPASGDARQVRFEIQQQLQKQALLLRIKGLLEDADKCLGERQFSGGIARLESARNLDPSDIRIAHRLEMAKAALDHHQKADALIQEAKEKLGGSDVTGAFQMLSSVMQTDPNHPEAQPLLDAIQSELRRKEVSRQFAQRLSRAKGMLAAEQFDEAFAIADALLAEFPESPEVAEVRERIRVARDEHGHRKVVSDGASGARELLAKGDWDGAIGLLEELHSKFPNESLFADLLLHAKQERQAALDHQKSESLKSAINAALKGNQFDEALRLVQHGLGIFPGDAEFSRLLRSTLDLQRAYERKKAIDNCEAKASELGSKGDPEGALQLIVLTVAEHGSSEALSGLQRRLGAEIQEKLRVEAIHKVIVEARNLMVAGRFKPAIERLHNALRDYPGNAEILSVLAEAQRELEATERDRALARLKKSARELAGVEDFDGALAEVKQGLRQYPDDPELQAWEQEFNGAKAARQLESEISAVLRNCGTLFREGKHLEALDLLGRLDPQVSSDPRIEALRARLNAQIEAETAHQKAESMKAEIEGSIQQNQFDEALRLVQSGMGIFPGDPDFSRLLRSVRELQRATQRREAIDDCAAKATELTREGDAKGALQLVGAAVEEYGADERLSELQERLSAEVRQQLRAEEIQDIIAEARKLVEAGRARMAVDQLRLASKEYPDTPEISLILEDAERQVEATERERALARLKKYARELAGVEDFDGALEQVNLGLQKYSEDPELQAWEQEFRRAKAERQIDLEISALLRNCGTLFREGKYAEALDLLDGLDARISSDQRIEALRARLNAQIEAEGAKQKAESLKAAIDSSLHESRFDEALRLVRSGLGMFPGDAEFSRLLRKALDLQRERERATAIEGCVAKASELGKRGDPEGALQLIAMTIAEQGEDERLSNLVEGLNAELEGLRAEAVAKVIREARELMDAGRSRLAVDRLRQSLREYPENPEIPALLAEAQQGLEATERERALARLKKSARELAGVEDFDGALAQVKVGLEQNPSDPELQAWEQEFNRAKADRQIEGEISALLLNCGILFREGKHTKALDLLSKLDPRVSVDPRIEALRARLNAQIEADKAKQKNREIEARLAEAGRLEAEGSLLEAVKLLEGEAARNPGDVQFSNAIERLRRKIQEKERQAISAVLSRAKELEAAGKIESALKEVHSALESSPENAQLIESAHRLEILIEAVARSSRIHTYSEGARKLTAEQSFDEAIDLLLTAQRKEGMDSRLTALLQEIRRLKADQEEEKFRLIQSAIAQAALQEQEGDLAKALQVIETALESFPDDFELRREGERLQQRWNEAERRKAISASVSDIERSLAAEDVVQAAATLQAAQQEFGDQAAFVRLSEELSDVRRRLQLRKRTREIEFLCSEGNWLEAAKAIQAARREFPDDPNLLKYQETIERQKSVFQALDAARQQLSKRNTRKAEKLVLRALAYEPESEEAKNLLAAVRSLREAEPPRPFYQSQTGIAIGALGAVALAVIIFLLFANRNQVTPTVKSGSSPSVPPSASSNPPVVPSSSPRPLAVAQQSLPRGDQGKPYVYGLELSGGLPPYSWRLKGGRLPAGVKLRGDGVLFGVPSESGAFKFIIMARDSAGQQADRALVVAISPAPKTPIAAPIQTGQPAQHPPNEPPKIAQAPPIPKPTPVEPKPNVSPAITPESSCTVINAADWRGDSKGRIKWSPIDSTDTTGPLTISITNKRSANSGVTTYGKLLGSVPARVRVVNGNAKIVDQPNRKNCYTAFSFEFPDGHASPVELEWSISDTK